MAKIMSPVDKIGITRTNHLASTETIQAHAESSLNRYQL